jgi:hypothetical protein
MRQPASALNGRGWGAAELSGRGERLCASDMARSSRLKITKGQISTCQVLLIVTWPDTTNTFDSKRNRRIDQANDYIKIELKTALSHQIPIIPVLIENIRMPSPDELPIDLRDVAFRQAVTLRANPDFRQDMEKRIHYLVQYLKRV